MVSNETAIEFTDTNFSTLIPRSSFYSYVWNNYAIHFPLYYYIPFNPHIQIVPSADEESRSGYAGIGFACLSLFYSPGPLSGDSPDSKNYKQVISPSCPKKFESNLPASNSHKAIIPFKDPEANKC